GIALIQFDPGVFGTEQTIGLSNPLPAINGDLEIAGPGTNLLRISASGFRAFTVIGGTVTFHSFSITGGGVEASGGSLTIGNSPVNISGNNTNVCGGGLLVNGASVTLQAGSQITGNTTSDNGGGVCVTAGSLTVTGGGTQVNGNIATLDGGGIYLSGGTVTVENGASVSGNTAANGGGIHQAGGNLTVTGSRIEQNTSTAGNGSAIRFADQGVRSVTNTCIVSNNDTAVTLAGGSGVVATGNWWGSSFGPFSGANAPAPNDPNTLVSTGDAVQLSLDPGIFDYSGYITTPVVGCLACVTPSGIGGGRDSRMCNFVTPP
ncbi:MAG: hypothetical protein IAE80_15405, partial [Anaerolinea sp.]|nr:hypothetical protein [Anaerolinea sp.]